MDQEVLRLCSYDENLQCKTMFFGHGLWTGCALLQGLYVSPHQNDPQSITAHIITNAVWSCPSETSARASILGFPPFHLLNFGLNEHIKRPDLVSVQSVRVCALFILLHRGEFMYFSQCLTVYVCFCGHLCFL